MRQLQHFAALRRKHPGSGPAALSCAQTTSAPADENGGTPPKPASLADMIDALESDILVAIEGVIKAIGTASAEVGSAGDDLARIDSGMKDLSAAGQGAATQTVGLAASTEELAATSGEITNAMDLATKKVQEAISCARGANTLIGDLAKATEEIVGIVDTISAVARQTNLLALNATIEAARAGTAGRGFAVVASEVKALSVETGKAANDIRARIAKLRDSAGSSIRVVEKVVSVIQEVQPVFSTVRTAVDDQNASLAELSQRATEASDYVKCISAKAQEIDETANGAAGRVVGAGQAATSAEGLARALAERFVTVIRQTEAGDRRRHDRFPVHLNATLHMEARSLATHTIDISAGGVLLANLHGISAAPGYSLSLEIERIGRLTARVVAVSSMGLHCVFADLDLDSQSRLTQVIGEVEEEYRPLIVVATTAARRIEAMFEQVIAEHRLTREQFFDTNYRPIPGTDPQQYETAYTQVLEDLLPGILEPLLVSDNRLSFCVAVDRNGYTPVHNRKYSQPQRPGDAVWNTANSRNKRIFDHRAGLTAARSSRPFVIQSFARDMGGGRTVMLREIDVPIRLFGRQWGGFRMCYHF